MKVNKLHPEYVEFMPKVLEDGVLYISEKYMTAAHKCCCGCGQKVVTPLRATEWTLSKTTSGVTLHPSVGNWGFACRSHYYIRNNQVIWAGDMTEAQIQRGRRLDQIAKEEYFAPNEQLACNRANSFFGRIISRLFGD
ncbi:hypothetical protein GCM10027277_25960 [Pseudoduganella ginsengisoli]|uniref:Uncharacterized protein n=1 Tax=Pseudoduganella ginsengisoli TaxID=1462440 RepID=A0A6L6PZ32_9BURK|nr:DUF6527 family protein [Pseudoduganella ginsengisoli]MTW02685.1 hypothetical protein [Pseudoduganella ginsengisoli]